MLETNNVSEGIHYLEQALKADSNYPNTYFGLGVAYEKNSDDHIAFDYFVKCMKLAQGKNKPLYDIAMSSAISLANNIIQANDIKDALKSYKERLEKLCGLKIRVESDNSIPTAAKLEIAENYQRDHHLVKYNDSYPAVAHLIMHELVHLQFVIEARAEKENLLFMTTQSHKAKFIMNNKRNLVKLSKQNYSEESIAQFVSSLFEGLSMQMFNSPVDLFIEDLLYNQHPDFRPHQFISLNKIIVDGVLAVTSKDAERLTPSESLSISKVLNMVGALQYNDLFGISYTGKFKATPIEQRKSQVFWDEYLEYREDRKPAEEYELINNWAKDLNHFDYFELVDEVDFRTRVSKPEDLIESLERDSFSSDEDPNFKDRQSKLFQESSKEIGFNSAVMFFMVEALQYFEPLPMQEVRNIAMEIATLGTRGINPGDGSKYSVNAISNKSFSGFQLLAFYYVSWKLAIPEMVDKLNMPYANEFEAAYKIHKPIN